MQANHIDARRADGSNIVLQRMAGVCSGWEVKRCFAWRAIRRAFEEGRAREQLAASPEGKNADAADMAGG